jgi:hypothetical protein
LSGLSERTARLWLGFLSVPGGLTGLERAIGVTNDLHELNRGIHEFFGVAYTGRLQKTEFKAR